MLGAYVPISSVEGGIWVQTPSLLHYYLAPSSLWLKEKSQPYFERGTNIYTAILGALWKIVYLEISPGPHQNNHPVPPAPHWGLRETQQDACKMLILSAGGMFPALWLGVHC